MDENNFFAQHLNWRMTESYNMSIQLRLDGLSFSILDPVTNQYLALTNLNLTQPDPNYALQEQYLLTNKTLNLHYRRVTITIDTPTYSLIPSPLYDPLRADTLLTLNGIRLDNDHKTLTNNIEMANSTTIFTIPNFLYFFLQSQYPNAQILHSTTPIITSLLLKRQQQTPTNNALHATLSPGAITITTVKNNQLQLCNTFYCRETPDYTYMTLYTLQQLNLNPLQTTLTISGNVNQNDPRITHLQHFLPNIHTSSLPNYFDYAFPTPPQPHRYNTLLLTPLCA